MQQVRVTQMISTYVQMWMCLFRLLWFHFIWGFVAHGFFFFFLFLEGHFSPYGFLRLQGEGGGQREW